MILNCTSLADILNDKEVLYGMRVSEIAANSATGAQPYCSPAAQILRQILMTASGKKVVRVTVETE